jgi:hypothetical protein
MGLEAVPVRVTVKVKFLVPLLPSVVLTSLMESVGRSSLVIVPVTGVVVPIVYPVPDAKVKITVSSGSIVVSAVGSRVKVAVAELAVKVMVLPVPGVAPV